jgi:hypothetical protein
VLLYRISKVEDVNYLLKGPHPIGWVRRVQIVDDPTKAAQLLLHLQQVI